MPQAWGGQICLQVVYILIGKMISLTSERNCHFPLPGILPWGRNLSTLELYITISLFLKEKHLPDFLCEENILILVFQSNHSHSSRSSIEHLCSYRWATEKCWLRASLIFTPNSLCCLNPRSCLTLLQPHGLEPEDRLLCPWDLPSKNSGVGCHFLLCYS